MEKRVVLLAINSKFIHSSLAVWLIKAGVSKFSRFQHDVNIIEATIHQPYIEIINAVAAYEPDVIGVSTYIWNARVLPVLLKSLKERLPDTIIVLGGPEAEHNTDYWLKQGADHVLSGEGEYVFPMFLDELSTLNSPLSSLLSPLSTLLSQPPDPYTDEYLASVQNRLIYFEASRGCPFCCAYCLSAETDVVFFPMDVVKERLHGLTLAQGDGSVVLNGTTEPSPCATSRTIKFVDRTFNCDAKRAYELFEYIINLDTDCCFHFEVAADLFDDRTLALLKTAPPGRIQFEIGLQSFYEPTLKAVSRKTNLEKAARNITVLLQSKNIHIHVDLIAGLPYEALRDFQNSFERAYELKPHVLQLGFLKLLHGSVLRKQADDLKIEYSNEAPYEIQSSPWLSADDIQTLKHVENALQHTYNKNRFLRTIDYALAVSNLQPFSFYRALGEAAPNHGTALQDYAVQVFDFCMGLPNMEKNELCDHMVCDWLSMVKGKNMPNILRNKDIRRKQEFERIRNEWREERGERRVGGGEYEVMPNREFRRDEVRILSSSLTVFVDSSKRCPVTGLYEVRVEGLA